MTSRIQTQRYSATGQRPANGARASGELWLNVPDMRLGMINPAQAPVDLLPIRVYSASAGYAAGDFVVNAGQLLQARAAIPAKPFVITDWNQYQSIAQSDARYLPLTGGTLTGPLTLAANPTGNLQASTKSYVDTTAAAGDATVHAYVDTSVAKYLPLAGGNMTGALGVGGTGISFPGLGGIWSAHHLAFGWDGGAVECAVDGSWVGYVAMQSWVSATYLALSGGTVGNLSVNAGITYAWLGSTYAHAMSFGWDGNIQCWVDGTYEGALATQGFVSNYLPLAGGTLSGTLRVANGRVLSYNAGNNPAFTCYDTAANFACGMWSAGSTLFFGNIDGAGNPAAGWAQITSDATFRCAGNLAVGGLSGQSNFSLSASGGAYSLSFSNWGNLTFQNTTGNLIWYRYDGTPLFYCDNGGSLHANQSFVAAASLFGMGGDTGLYAGGSGRVLQFAGNWYFDWNGSNGTLQWIANGQGFWMMRASDGLCANNIGYVFAQGFSTPGDLRELTDIAPTNCGLDAILRLNPVRFRRDGKDRIELGFIAQDVAGIIPEAVHTLGIPLPDGAGALDSDTPTLGLSFNPIIAALVNAAKQLDQRLRSLEGNP
jgi:hypothetical protein